MTYTELIIRAAITAHKFEPATAIDRFQATAETIFPSVVEELAQSVAADITHPWRSVLADETAALADGAQIPDVSTNNKPIIGVYGNVRDADDDRPLANVFTLSEIRALNLNPNGWRKVGVYAFAIIKPRIYHTRDTVIIDVCVLDEADITAAIVADEIPLFPDAEGAYVNALMRRLLAPTTKFDANDYGQLTGVKVA